MSALPLRGDIGPPRTLQLKLAAIGRPFGAARFRNNPRGGTKQSASTFQNKTEGLALGSAGGLFASLRDK